jgi:hypothetical protein
MRTEEKKGVDSTRGDQVVWPEWGKEMRSGRSGKIKPRQGRAMMGTRVFL